MSGSEPRLSSTIVVTRDGDAGLEVLLLERSSRVGTYRGRWAGVSGFLEVADPEQQMWTELREELSLGPDQLILECAGEPLAVSDPELGRDWLVHPFRFSLADGVEPRLDWEHVQQRWVAPEMIRDLDVVPGLWEAWCRVEAHRWSKPSNRS